VTERTSLEQKPPVPAVCAWRRGVAHHALLQKLGDVADFVTNSILIIFPQFFTLDFLLLRFFHLCGELKPIVWGLQVCIYKAY
jgi:hypothetical protein